MIALPVHEVASPRVAKAPLALRVQDETVVSDALGNGGTLVVGVQGVAQPAPL